MRGRTGIQSRGSEDPVHQPSAHSHKQSGRTAESSLEEDCRRVIGDNVDATKLLHKHHKAGTLDGAPVSRHSKELQEEIAAFLNINFSFYECVHVEHIASGLERCGPEA